MMINFKLKSACLLYLPDYYRDSPHFRRQGEGRKYYLEIPNAKLDYTGTYSVVATNVHGKAKAVISLQIYAKGQGKEDRMDHSPVTHGKVESLPTFTKGLKDIRCCDGDAVTLECVVSTTETPEIRWKKDGKLLPKGSDFETNFDGSTATLNIKQVYPEDEGEYTCIAYNDIGRTYTSACLVVDVPEEKENLLSRQLTRQPGIMSGASTPRSTPRTTPSRSISPFTSSWREPSTSSVRQKRLKVTSPKFYAVPHNRVAEEGETIRFQCAVSGHPTPWVAWDKDNVAVTPTRRITISEKDDLKVLEIEEVTVEDAGLYRVTVENEVGRIEATARLDVIGAKGHLVKAQNVHSWSSSPSFRRRLSNSVGRIGDRITLACDVTSSPDTITSWYRNGDLIVRTNKTTPTWDGVSAMLEIEDLEEEDSGIYACVAENDVGKTYCSAELMIVKNEIEAMPPMFVEPLKDVMVEEGNPAELKVEVKGSSPLDVVWVKDNKEIPNCPDFRYVDYDDGRFGLRIADAFLEDSGKYICEVFNQYGEAVSSAELLVKEIMSNRLPKIEFSKKPTSVGITSGSDVSFCCRLQRQESSFHSTLVQWAVGNVVVDSQTISNKYSVEESGDTSILHIGSVNTKDAGKITCTARYVCLDCTKTKSSSNKCSCLESVVSCTAELSVFTDNDGEDRLENLQKIHSQSTEYIKNDSSKNFNFNCSNCPVLNTCVTGNQQPKILCGPMDANTFKGENVVLRATYIGQPEPQVQWLKGGQLLQNSEKVTIKSGEGTTSLSISGIDSDDSGKYLVSVTNELGTVCHFASVSVKGPPDPPATYPLVKNIGNNEVEIEWTSPAFDGGSQITGYVVEMKTSAEDKWKGISGLCHSLSYTAKNLQTNTKYRFRIKAENVYGQSEPSYESNVITVALPDSESKDEIVTIQSGEVFKGRYQVLEELGKGRYGVVHKVEELETGRKLAAKFIRCIKMKDREKVKEEIQIMNFLRHPKLLSLEAAFENPREFVMVMEYISGGELFERVVADDFQLTERDCILFMRQICEGVEYMHKNNIVHLDLKPENIMCQSKTSHEIKLIDFGLAQKLDPNTPVRVLFGTPEFVPPEIINYEPIGLETDMWSVGVICYVLLSGLSPFMGENDAETFANITRATFDFDDEAFDAISQDAKDFISMLIVKRKEKRLTASDCLKNKWMMSEHDKTMKVILSTDKLKKFIIRRKWQKTANAIRALGRMASLSAASRKNSNRQNLQKLPTFQEDDQKNIILVPECTYSNLKVNDSSLEMFSNTKKPCMHKSTTDKVKNLGVVLEEPKISQEEKHRSKLFSERSDSGISDCSSIGSNHSCQCQATLLNKKYSITEEIESKFYKTERNLNNSNMNSNNEILKNEIDNKMTDIRAKFANLSKNIDEMDRQLVTVTKKLTDITPGQMPVASHSEIKRVPSLKEQKSSEILKSTPMQHSINSQSKVTIPLKQPINSPKLISTFTIPVTPDSKNPVAPSNQTKKLDKKVNSESAYLPAAIKKLPNCISINGEGGGEFSRLTKAQPTPKFQKIQEKCTSKVAAAVKNLNEKSECGNWNKSNKTKNIDDKTSSIKVIRSNNFKETVAFWKR